MSAFPNAGCHAVLAPLSGRYPPLEGRSPTCYSPVCHSTDPLRGFRVRLACVRHAASVDSEPGSNSHVKGDGGSKRPALPQTRAPVDLALSRCSVRQVIGGSQPDRRGELNLGPPVDAAPPADTRRVVHLRALRRSGGRSACTFYLVFKEPRTTVPSATDRLRGNLPILLEDSLPCQPLSTGNTTEHCWDLLSRERKTAEDEKCSGHFLGASARCTAPTSRFEPINYRTPAAECQLRGSTSRIHRALKRTSFSGRTRQPIALRPNGDPVAQRHKS
jgi:hypothetical protein